MIKWEKIYSKVPLKNVYAIDTVYKHGILPYAIQRTYSGLVKSFLSLDDAKILKFSDLNINNNSALENLNIGNLTKAVMPLQQTSIKVDYLRESDFVLNLSRTINVDVTLNGNKLTNTIDVRFEPDYKLLALFVVILLVILSILFFLTYKVIKRRH